jgi:3alpha(or 20beta)-hydroxysteroid dehydrogenase
VGVGKLEGRVALITGGARGQGEAEARLFVAEGARVVVGDVLVAPGQALATELGEACAFCHLDVASEADWDRAVALAEERFGKLDALVNNAGILRFFPIRDCSLEAYTEVVQVNQVGVLLGMRAAIDPMSRAGGGTIVNVSSVNGLIGIPGTVAYTATKFAVRGMTKVAALELGRLGIRVNSIHPGAVDTPMVSPEALGPMAPRAGAADPYRRLPLGRQARPEEMARLVLFLSCEDSSYCTGAEFVADGGMLAGLPLS